MNIKNALAIVLIFTTMLSCSKEEDGVTNPIISSGVFVMNEGQFGMNTASVAFKPDNEDVIFDWFKNTNDRPLGDIYQSFYEADDAYYLVLNGSAKIEKVTKNELRSIATIDGLSSPRYFAMHDIYGYVTNLKFDTSESKIELIDLTSNKRFGSLSEPIYGWCEEIIIQDDIMYVANTGMHQLLVYDLISGTDFETYDLPKEPINIKIDKYGMVWVLCSGGYLYGDGQAALCRFNPSTKAVDQILKFSDSKAYPSRMVIDENKENLYFISNGVYKVNVDEESIPDAPFISNKVYFYGLGIHPKNNNIYVGDAKSFDVNGTVYVYSPTTELIESFESGVGPNGFIFR